MCNKIMAERGFSIEKTSATTDTENWMPEMPPRVPIRRAVMGVRGGR